MNPYFHKIRHALFYAAIAHVLLSSCSDPICTLDVLPGIEVRIYNMDGDSINEGVTGELEDGAYSEILTQSFDGIIRCAIEREGKYSLNLYKEGFHSYEKSGIVVRSDECHVHTVQMNVFMQPL